MKRVEHCYNSIKEEYKSIEQYCQAYFWGIGAFFVALWYFMVFFLQ